jgi:sugar O-acyltransferase (sialic acid O-acetyltransferase NeuD family)
MTIEQLLHQDTIYILGASGHGKTILSNLLSAGFKIITFLDDKPALQNTTFSGYTVSGSFNTIYDFPNPFAVIAVGDNSQRKMVAQKYPHVKWIPAIHNSSILDNSVIVGSGSAIMAGSVVQPDTVIGKHSIINTGATIDHDCRIDDFVHIAPGTHLAGNVSIGRCSFIGIGCQVLQKVCIGSNSYIGAGSTVICDIPDNVIAYGTPAKIIKSYNINKPDYNQSSVNIG